MENTTVDTNLELPAAPEAKHGAGGTLEPLSSPGRGPVAAAPHEAPAEGPVREEAHELDGYAELSLPAIVAALRRARDTAQPVAERGTCRRPEAKTLLIAAGCLGQMGGDVDW